MLCDKAGVPELVQRLRFSFANFSFVVDLFNGARVEFDAGNVCPSIDLLQAQPSRMQMLQAQNAIEKHLLANWQRYT